MKEIMARGLLVAAGHLEKLQTLLDEWESPSAPVNEFELSPKLRHNIAGTYRFISEAAEVIGAPVTKKAADRARKRLLARKEVIDLKGLKQITTETRSRLEDEVESTRFYCLAPGSAELYSPQEPLFGKEVEARIEKASDDISEAGKCFAVGRYTASVFHLMRAMEAAVKELSAHLKIEKLEREWGKLLSDIRTKIEAMPKGRERDDWSEVHANLYHVKQAWRNDTMHPKATYTEEEAREVFDATKAFMGNLAALLPLSAEEMIG